MATPRQVFVAVIGTGGVGKAFLSQLNSVSSRLSQSTIRPTILSLVLLARSSKALYSPNYAPIPLSSWAEQLDQSSITVPPLSTVVDYLSGAPGPVVLVDNTSNQDIAAAYPDLLSNGIHVITPNKKAFSSDLSLWDRIFAAAANGSGKGGYVYHESTVGAGIPVLSTLNELIETGDSVKRVEGVFSGTMSYLFNTWNPVDATGQDSQPFSACVTRARDLGYTEPDPRDDLNGMDVARKCTILARLSGLKVQEINAFPTQSLIPGDLANAAGPNEFLEGLKDFDQEMDKLKNEAATAGKVVRFVGSVDVTQGRVSVGLKQFDKDHPIAALKGSDNIYSFYTERYGDNPLIIQGAGAGGDVTAMGVTGDLIKILKMLP